MTPAETNRSPLSTNLPMVLLAALLLLAIVAAVIMMNRNTTYQKLSTEQVEKIKNLDLANKQFESQMDSLNQTSTALQEKVEGLMKTKDRLISSRDSVVMLLGNVLKNDKNAKGKVAALEKQLKEYQNKLNGVQKLYDDLLANTGSSGVEYKQRLEALTSERDALAKENQELKKKVADVANTGGGQTVAIFCKTMTPLPGEAKSGKFSSSTRSQNTDRLQTTFTLTRAPKSDEQILFRVFDGTNKEVALNPSYRKELNAPANPINQKVMLVFEKMLGRKDSGRYSVRMYLTSTEKGIANQEIGVGSFELK